MKAIQFVVILLIGFSLLIPSKAVVKGIYSADINEIPDRILTVQGKSLTGGNKDIYGQGADLPSDESPAHLALVTQSKVSSLDDQYIAQQWALTHIRIVDLQAITPRNPEVLVAVLDTGIDQNHKDLKGKVVGEINFTDSSTPKDIHGHGTHVAGIITGSAPESQLLNVKVADDRGRCQATVVAEGIIWAVDKGASVINISLEIREPSPELEDAVNYAWGQGAIIIAAAGNSGSRLPVYPAYYENSIAVAAIRKDGTLAPLSDYGDWVDVIAPGFKVHSTLPNNSYGCKSGTSFATGYVSALAAMFFAILTDTSGNYRLNDEVRSAIETRCAKMVSEVPVQGQIKHANSCRMIVE